MSSGWSCRAQATSSGTGNALNNTLVGTSGNNLLNGGAGNDYMVGGAGNDIFVVAAGGDRTIEAANGGIDTVRSYINWTLADNVERLELQGSNNLSGTGNSLNNTLVGNAGNNLLNGGAGNDYMVGGAGNDIFIVDASGDRVIEAANGGIPCAPTSTGRLPKTSIGWSYLAPLSIARGMRSTTHWWATPASMCSTGAKAMIISPPAPTTTRSTVAAAAIGLLAVPARISCSAAPEMISSAMKP
jgi:RTX calcium-binding nonapeptide repeat (4 copies)